MEVSKIESDFGLEIDIKLENGIFQIYYGGNLDLYWSFYPENCSYNYGKEKAIISKENEIYLLFEILYNDILNCDFSKNSEILKQSGAYKSLCQNGVICWHSDNQVYEDANCVSIKKIDDSILLEFDFKNEESENTICFSNNGSRYMPFNQPFMKLYQVLCDTDFKSPKSQKVKFK